MTYEYAAGMGLDVTPEMITAALKVSQPSSGPQVSAVMPKSPLTPEEHAKLMEQLRTWSDGQIRTMIRVWQRAVERETAYAKGASAGAAPLYQAAADKAAYRLRLARSELANRERKAELERLRRLQTVPTEPVVAPAPASLPVPPTDPPHPWGDSATVDLARQECQAQGMDLVKGMVREGRSNMGFMQACCTPSSQSHLLTGDYYCCPDIEHMTSGVREAVMTAMSNALVAANPALPSAMPADQAAAEFHDVVRQFCQRSPCDAEVVKLILTSPLYGASPIVQQALPICNQAIAQQQAATQGQAPAWYKHPAVLVGGGVLGALALMKLMGRGGMERNPAYKVGDLVVNVAGAVGRVVAVHDDYLTVTVKSGWVWAKSNWPYDMLKTDPRDIEWAIKMAKKREEIPVANPTKMLAPVGKPYYMTKSAGQPDFYRVYGETDFGEELIGRVTGTHPAGFYIHWVRGVHGPAARYKKGPHKSANAAADEVYRAWQEQGRVWIGE